MHDETIIVRDRQLFVRTLLDERGILLRQVQHKGGWDDPSTVQSWFPKAKEGEPVPPQPKIMSVAGLYRLISKDAVPLDLLSLLLPTGFAFVRVPEAVDHDEIAEAVADYLLTKERAHHPESEAGREIGPTENNVLCGKFARVKAAAA